MSCSPLRTIHQHILEWSRETPSAVAATDGDRTLTFSDFAQRLAQVAKGVEQLGVGPGRIIGLACSDRTHRLLVMLACEALGGFHLALEPGEIGTDNEPMRRCDLILSDAPAQDPGATPPIASIDQDFFARIAASDVSAEDLDRLGGVPPGGYGGRIARTSGTTGGSKFMRKTAEIADAILHGYDNTLGVLDRGVTFICIYSPAIGGVYTDILRALRCGGQVRFASSFKDVLDACALGPCYTLFLPREAEQVSAECKRRNLSLNLLYVDVTGAAASPGLREALEATVSPRVVNIYSSNETSIIASQGPDGLFTLCAGVEIRILDAQGQAVAPGEVGVISVRSPMQVQGYLWNEALTAKHFSDGWLLMSDLGRIPEPGKLQILGRHDDMLNIGGEKIAPYPIEQAMKAIEGIEDAILLRVETEAGVGLMCAVLEIASGRAPDGVVEAARRVLAVRGRRFIIRVEARLPRTETGKVRRELVQRRVQAELSAEITPPPLRDTAQA